MYTGLASNTKGFATAFLQDIDDNTASKENVKEKSEFVFAAAIREGNVRDVQKMLNNHENIWKAKLSFRIKLKVDTTARTIHYITIADFNGKELEKAKMNVSPLQLAIISKQEMVVQAILEHVYLSDDNGEHALKTLLEVKTQVQFPRDSPNIYEEDDRMLDGMNTFHLAAKFHPQSLQTIISFLQNEDASEIITLLTQGKDPHIQNTPLHIAANSPSSFAMR